VAATVAARSSVGRARRSPVPGAHRRCMRSKAAASALQLGGESTDVVLLVMNDRGMDALLRSKLTLGGTTSAAAGPKGRSLAGSTDGSFRAEILSYSRSRGLASCACWREINARGWSDRTVAGGVHHGDRGPLRVPSTRAGPRDADLARSRWSLRAPVLNRTDTRRPLPHAEWVGIVDRLRSCGGA